MLQSNARTKTMSEPENKDKLLKKLFDRYFPHLVIYAKQIVGSREVAEDVVQEVFLKLWQKDKLQMKSLNYLYSCVKNASINYTYSKEGKVLKISDEFIPAIVADDYSIDQEIEKMKLLEELYTAIEKLPPQSREVLKLVYLKRQKYTDVAEQMGISLNTVKTHMTRAYKLLRKHFSHSSLVYLAAFFENLS